METWTIIASVSSGIAVLISGIALVSTIWLTKRQLSLTATIHQQQTLLTQRQLLLPLWEYLIDLNDINPVNPVWPDVIKAVNSLELVAVCWEGQLLDEDVLRRVFLNQYIDFYEKIEQCQNPPSSIRLSGREMLRANRATGRLYGQLRTEFDAQNELKPILKKE